MKTVEIIDKGYRGSCKYTRDASRGIIVRDGKILISHEVNSGHYLLPGGGMEDGETPEECCIRELLEETGYIVRIVKPIAVIKEYYEEAMNTSYIYVCEIVGEGEHKPTEQEIEVGAQPEWIDYNEMRNKYASCEEIRPGNEGIYRNMKREFEALKAYEAECSG